MMDGLRVSRRTALASGLCAVVLPGVLQAAGKSAVTVSSYRGIRYGRAERFGPAELLDFAGYRPDAGRGPVSPQYRSRLAFALGDQPTMPQDEHCQYLSVFTPAHTGRRPVIVFLHGGAFISGGGELPWYDGDRLAAEQDVVVVTVTSRLGALGYWLEAGAQGPSPAMTDQIAALRWVQANIAQFGGDPANVTLAGQSAGSATAMQLIEWGHGEKLFHRIIGMSAYRQKAERSAIEASSRKFDAVLGIDPRRASVAELMAAQSQMPVAGPDREHTWQPVGPDRKAAINVDVLTGWTREDPSAGMAMAAGRGLVPGTPLEPYRQANARLVEATTDYAREVAAAGRKAWLYSFDWNGPDTGLGNCHCIDLSFVFGDRQAWEAAPMLNGTDWNDHLRLAQAVRAQWGAFARHGTPAAARLATWRPVTANAAPVTSLA